MRGTTLLVLITAMYITAVEAADQPAILFNVVDFAAVASAGGADADAGEPSKGSAGNATHAVAKPAALLLLLMISASIVSASPTRATCAMREADAAEKRTAVRTAVVVSCGGIMKDVTLQGAADAALHSLLQEPGVESAFFVEEAPLCSLSM